MSFSDLATAICNTEFKLDQDRQALAKKLDSNKLLEICDMYRCIGCGSYLMDLNKDEFTNNLFFSAKSYLYLLQKREEAIISQTVTSSNVKIIDAAYSRGKVSPQGKMIYIGALFLGLFSPFGIIYVKDLLDTKIHNREDLETIIKDITVLGEIPRLKGKDLRYLGLGL